MPEVKSVKVDNWGVFFLQKLQNFFNKTDYCDLTLQFKDNSQLKVHRLVLSACTDFFNVLEQRYNVTDDILIMPKDLQADVVVPIVNFMYTGTLEFEMQMYARLLKTARDMNMNVLLRLLEAHKRTVVEPSRAQPAPVLLNKGANQRVNTYSRPTSTASPATTQRTYVPRRPVAASKTSPHAGKIPFNPVVTKIKTEKSSMAIETRSSEGVRNLPSTSYLRKNLPEPVQMVVKYANNSAAATVKGPSRFECTDDNNLQETFESSFDNISYESKPLVTASQVNKDDTDYDSASSSFEQLKRSYTGTVKRTYSSSTSLSPPEKKPNLQEIKELSEAHRLRKEIVADEFDNDGGEYYGDDFQGTDDDEDMGEAAPSTSAMQSKSAGGSVIIKSDGSNPVNHAKIISEVLKKYPHLVKNNKNIKLKIMQKGNTAIATTVAKESPTKPIVTRTQSVAVQQAANIKKTIPEKPVPAPANQPKKIDSRTMHALIAKGAENTTGPWLCLECGVNGRPISIPSYKGFRRHLINVHRQKIDQRLCEHCGWRSTNRTDLHHHMFIEHQIKPPKDLQFPKCGLCNHVALDQNSLRKHKEEDHQNQSSQQHCIYCNRTFAKEIALYTHMRTLHKERAQEDGVMDFSDDENDEDDSDKYVPNHPESAASTAETKIKVLSNIALPNKSAFVLDSSNTSSTTIIAAENLNLEPSSEAEALSTVASGIATSMAVLDSSNHAEGEEAYQSTEESTQYIEAEMANVHGELVSPKKSEESTELVTKFITEEGSELQLTAAQKAELLEQLQGQGEGITDNVVMVLNEEGFEQLVYDEQPAEEKAESTAATTEEVVAPDTAQTESMEWQEAPESEEDGDLPKNEDSQLENEHTDGDTSAENLENIRACISKEDSVDEDEGEDEAKIPVVKEVAEDGKETKANQLISALEGDWTEDEEDDGHDGKQKGSPKKEIESDTEDVLVETITKALPVAEKVKKTVKSDDSDATAKKTDKSVSNLLLDDWNDSQQSENVEAVTGNESDASKKEDVEVKVVKSEPEQDDIETIKKKVEKKKTEENSTSKTSKNGRSAAPKSEIKTLINDWGDEEDEEEAY